MYGLIIQNLQSFLIKEFGEEKFHQIRLEAGIEEHVFSIHEKYNDDIIERLAMSAAKITGWTKDQILRGMGLQFPRVCGEFGYYKMLKTVGRNLYEFVNGLDYMHQCLSFSYPGMQSPSFYCDQETEEGLRLHYRSKRKGYVNYVLGQLEEMANYLFNMKITTAVESEIETDDGTHAIILLKFDNKVTKRKVSTGTSHICPTVSTELILETFPFHLLFRDDMKMFGIGVSLEKVLPHIDGKLLTDTFKLLRPSIPFTWKSVSCLLASLFCLSLQFTMYYVTCVVTNRSKLHCDLVGSANITIVLKYVHTYILICAYHVRRRFKVFSLCGEWGSKF